MQLHKRLAALGLSLLLSCCFALTAYARETADPSRRCSVTVGMTYNGAPVGGGTLTLYRVGALTQEDGNDTFVPTGDFADCGLALDDVESADLAFNLVRYATEHSLSGVTRTIDENGRVTFDDLETGLYLFAQFQGADGYNAAGAFLVSLPLWEDGAYLYDVDASPKVALEVYDPGSGDDGEPSPTPAATGSLPQTGQLNWPVPVLAGAGLCLLLLGWALRGKKEEPYEK